MKRIIIALGLMSLAGPLHAGLVLDTEPLAVSVQREPVDTVAPIYRAYMNVGNQKFAFLIPENFRLGGDPSHGRLQLENTQAGTTMTLHFLHSPGFDTPETGREVYRELLSSRYVNGKFVGEFTRPAVGNTGVGFDVQWATAAINGSNLVQRTRAIFLPTRAGLLELSITTSAKNASTAEGNLDEVLRSLASSVNGQLAVHHIAASN